MHEDGKHRARRTVLLAGGLVVAGVVALALLVGPPAGDGEAAERSVGAATRSDGAPGALSGDGASSQRAAGGERAALAAGTRDGAAAAVDEPGERLLRGRVELGEGTPLPGVEVALTFRTDQQMTTLDLEEHAAERELMRARSDEDGRFSFHVEPDRDYALAAPADPGTRYGRAVASRLRAGDEVVLVLRPAGRILGAVVERGSEAPVAGAVVEAWTRSAVGETVKVPNHVTDGAGAFRIDGLDPGGYTVEVVPVAHRSPDWGSVRVEAGEVAELRFVVEPGAVLTGRVTDADTGAPIEGARVGEGWVFRKVALTDRDGRYALRGVGDSGMMEVHVEADGYGRSEAPIPRPEDGAVQVDFALQRARTAGGRVLGPDGAPLEGVYVAAIGMTFRGRLQPLDWRHARTGADGAFELRSLRRDLGHVLLLRAPEWATLVYDFPADEPRRDHVELGDLRMRAPGLVRGRVTDDEVRPVVRASVHCKGWNDDRERLGPMTNALIDSYVGDREVTTDREGRYELTDLPAGTFRLEVRRSGSPRPLLEEVVLATGERREGVDFRFAGGATISGTVLGPDGLPVYGAILRLRGEGARGVAAARSDAEGRFVFLGLPEGEFRIDVMPPFPQDGVEMNGRPASEELARASVSGVRSGDEAVRVVLPRASAVLGLVVDPGGEPVAKAFVYAVGAAGEQLDWSMTDEDGRFRLEVHEGGTVEVCVQATRADETSPVGVSPVDPTDLGTRAFDVAAGTRDLRIVLER